MENINQIRYRLGKELEEKCRKAAEERGEKFRIITKVIPFRNNDVLKYLAGLEKIEEESRKTKIMVGKSDYEQKSPVDSFKLPERERRLLQELFDWTERSAKSNYVFREAV